MFWPPIITVLAGISALFLWRLSKRIESKEKQKELEKKIDNHLEKTFQLVLANQKEIRDIHGRVCVIEEKIRAKPVSGRVVPF